MLESSLIKLQALRTAALLKKESNTGFLLWTLWIIQEHLFCVEDLSTAGSETPVRLFKNTFFYRTSPVAASDSFRFPACNFIKKETPAKMFICEFCKIFKNIFWQNTSGWLLLLFIWECLRSFSECLFYRAPLGNCLFHVQVAEFQPPDTIKSISQVLFKRRHNYSEAFIYLKSIKIICK